MHRLSISPLYIFYLFYVIIYQLCQLLPLLPLDFSLSLKENKLF